MARAGVGDVGDIEPPQAVRRKAELAGATDWLRDLPGLVVDLEDEWDLVVERVYQDASEALVLAVRTSEGVDAVLKLMIPRGDGRAAEHEATALVLADGQGCARLLRHDLARHALLLERLGPSLHDLGLPVSKRHEILSDLAATMWRPAPDSGLPTGREKAFWLIEFITTTWESLGRPCSEAAVAHALACADRRAAAHADESARLVHGDVHEWNALQRRDGSFALVDPDGLLADPAYDLGIIMREDPDELLRGDPHWRSRWLAARTGLDEVAIWEWGVVERVSTGLVLYSIGLDDIGRRMLATAEAVAPSA